MLGLGFKGGNDQFQVRPSIGEMCFAGRRTLPIADSRKFHVPNLYLLWCPNPGLYVYFIRPDFFLSRKAIRRDHLKP